MDYLESKHMMEFFGLFPNSTSNYVRFPPGLRLTPSGLIRPNQIKEKFATENISINSKLQDFQQIYQKFALGLIEENNSIIPPGHPLYTKQHSTTILQSENDKLRKENLELKKQLDKTPKPKMVQ